MVFDLTVAIILGIVEGATEFVPVSSTGHLIVVGALLGFEGERAATFEVFIQLGAILAVAWLYRARLLGLIPRTTSTGFAGWQGLGLLAVTTLPALVLGAAAHGLIRDYLFTPWTVAIGWGVGGVGILLAERIRPPSVVNDLDALSWRRAGTIGLFQCLALWPGVSRSASTMVGGMLVGVRRQTAAEYSFLAAIPVIAAASLFELATNLDILTMSDIPLFATGFLVSFVAAWAAVTFFLRLLATLTLRPFGWYRIVASLLLIAVLATQAGDM